VQLKVIRDSSLDFWINPDQDFDIYQFAPKMWIHCLIGISHFAKFHKNQPVNVCEMARNALFRNGEKMENNGKMNRSPCADPDLHQKSITSRGSPLAHVYRVWSTSISAIVSYPASRRTDRQNE